MSADLPKMREAFEALYGPASSHKSPHGHFVRFAESDKYIMDMVQVAWLAWQEATRQAMERCIETIAACRPAEPNCVWEGAFQHVCDENIAAIRSLLPNEEKRHG